MNTLALSLAGLVALGLLPTAAHADLSTNVGAVSDYRYRGISQTRLKPALQGGVDFSFDGLYLAPGDRPSSGSRTHRATRRWKLTSTAATRASSARAD